MSGYYNDFQQVQESGDGLLPWYFKVDLRKQINNSLTPALANPCGIQNQLWSLPRLDGLVEAVVIIPCHRIAALCLPVPLEPATLAGGYNSPVHRRLSYSQVAANPFLRLVVVACYLLRLETRPRNPQHGAGVSLAIYGFGLHFPMGVAFCV